MTPKTIAIIIVAAIGWVAIGYFLKYENEDEKKRKQEVEFLEKWKVFAEDEKEKSRMYLNDLNSIRDEVDNAVNGEDYDFKLMYAYFKYKAREPKLMKAEWDSLFNYYNEQFNRHTEGIKNADRKLDSISNID